MYYDPYEKDPLKRLAGKKADGFFEMKPIIIPIPFLPSVYRNMFNFQGYTGKRQAIKNYAVLITVLFAVIGYNVLFRNVPDAVYAVCAFSMVISIASMTVRRMRDIGVPVTYWFAGKFCEIPEKRYFLDTAPEAAVFSMFNPFRLIGFSLKCESDEYHLMAAEALQREERVENNV